MSYKVGDKVKIKDIDWYNEHKKGICNKFPYFTERMSQYCGMVTTILEICDESDICKNLKTYGLDIDKCGISTFHFRSSWFTKIR